MQIHLEWMHIRLLNREPIVNHVSRVPIQGPRPGTGYPGVQNIVQAWCPQQVFQLAHTPPADRYTINNITDRSRCKARVMNRPYTV